MNKYDVISALGEPDRILPRGMVSTAWFCSCCCKLHTFAYPVRPPAPCECGGIAFEKRSADQPAEKHAQGCPCPTCISDGPTRSDKPQWLTG